MFDEGRRRIQEQIDQMYFWEFDDPFPTVTPLVHEIDRAEVAKIVSQTLDLARAEGLIAPDALRVIDEPGVPDSAT